MATIVLSVGGSRRRRLDRRLCPGAFGRSDRALCGATLGRALDQRLMGQGAETVETGRVERFRLTGCRRGQAHRSGFRAGCGSVGK